VIIDVVLIDAPLWTLAESLSGNERTVTR